MIFAWNSYYCKYFPVGNFKILPSFLLHLLVGILLQGITSSPLLPVLARTHRFLFYGLQSIITIIYKKVSKIYLGAAAAAAAKLPQSCPTLCDPRDGSPSVSPVPGILQARTLEWVAISSSSAWKWKVKGKSLSPVWLVATPWTAAHQAPPSMGFSRREYWSGCHCLLCYLGEGLSIPHASACL